VGTISVLIEAEELGITSENLETSKTGKDPEVLYLLGVTKGIGKPAGLDDGWAERVIKAVGNYVQAFERNLGASSGLAIDRGLNATWRHGGLLYAMPAAPYATAWRLRDYLESPLPCYSLFTSLFRLTLCRN
jgi:general L-amino acid transport system substrate-binding protein